MNPWDSGQGYGISMAGLRLSPPEKRSWHTAWVVAHCLGIASGRAKVVPHLLGTVTKDVLQPIIQVNRMSADG